MPSKNARSLFNTIEKQISRDFNHMETFGNSSGYYIRFKFNNNPYDIRLTNTNKIVAYYIGYITARKKKFYEVPYTKFNYATLKQSLINYHNTYLKDKSPRKDESKILYLS